MPRFFFDTIEGNNEAIDDVGLELSDVKAARDEAIAVLPRIAMDVLPDGDHHVFETYVRDEGGHIVFNASFVLNSKYV